MKDKEKKMLFGIGIVFLFLATVGFSYAYFTAALVNKDVKDQVVTTGTLELTYVDGPEIKMLNIKPGTTFTKEVSVKNTGTLDTAYNFVWQELSNEITNNEMVMSATCERLDANDEVNGTCEGVSETAIGANIIKKNVSIESGITHKYVVTITFKDTDADQNYNQNKKFSGVLGINEYKVSAPEVLNCTFDGELTKGAEYINGPYTYHYQESWYSYGPGQSWTDLDGDGWGVKLTDASSTDAVTAPMCTYINDKPLLSMSSVFARTAASSVDLSTTNTKNVIDMENLFYSSAATSVNIENLDTSNVTNMHAMLREMNLTNPTLDVSHFDTSKVTDMGYMFYRSNLTSITGLENFNTSNVKNMDDMFAYNNMETLDVSSFDTSNVEYIMQMFQACYNLKTIYASDKFVLTKAQEHADYNTGLFSGSTNLVGGAGTTYAENPTDTKLSYAHIDGGTDNPGYFTKK